MENTNGQGVPLREQCTHPHAPIKHLHLPHDHTHRHTQEPTRSANFVGVPRSPSPLVFLPLPDPSHTQTSRFGEEKEAYCFAAYEDFD